MSRRSLLLFPLAAIMSPVVAQTMPGMTMSAPHDPAQHAETSPPVSEPDSMAAMEHGAMEHGAMDHGAMGHMAPGMAGMNMPALLGPYSMMREASGTSWQPESSPMIGVPIRAGAWSLMAQGYATFLYDDQGGPRGDSKTFSQSMLMLMGSRPVGAGGRLGLRAMVSLDPLMGRSGYPLLFATGETANGRTELVDRQHPHDFLMELAASYAQDLGGGRSVYLYGGLPGEPALGPPTFMHRISGMDDPEAPIGHHWFDSTHITFGVVTAGFATRTWKLEGSAFKGREPDQHRWDIEAPKLDSWSARAFWNPTPNWSFQASTGHLHSPEQLHPDEDEQRTTVSASYNRPLAQQGNFAATVAWSLKDQRPGPSLNGWLAEASLRLENRHILFGRLEREDESELFAEGDPLHHQIITVNKLSLGYAYEMPLVTNVRVALGGLASAYAFPDRLKPYYGGDGVKSFMLFARFRLASGMTMQ